MKGHAATIEGEVEKMIANWGDEGRNRLLDFFSELTIYTSTACLIGLKFREQLDSRSRTITTSWSAAPTRSAMSTVSADRELRRRDEARVKLVALVQEIMDRRLANPPKDKSDRDMLDVLVSIKDEDGTTRFSATRSRGCLSR